MPIPSTPLMQDASPVIPDAAANNAGADPIVKPIEPVIQPVVEPVNPDANPNNPDAPIIPDVILPEAIDVDGVIYTINTEGNAVDDTGNIFKTKDEILAELQKEPIVEVTEIDSIINLTNIKINDEEGNPIKYDASPEGIAKYVTDAYNQGAKDKGQEPVNQLLSTFPILKDIIPHLALHGNLDNFNKQVDYSTIEVDKTNTAVHKELIVSERMLKGDSREDAEYYFDLINKDGKSYDKAILAKELLVKNTEQVRLANETKLREREALAIKQETEYWNDIKSKVTNGKLTVNNTDYFIPEVIKVNDNGVVKTYNREDFFNYMYQPNQYNINNKLVTMTKHQYDEHVNATSRTEADDILDAYKLFVKGDMTQFINKQVDINNTHKIKKMFTSSAAGANSNRQTPAGDVVKINFPVSSR